MCLSLFAKFDLWAELFRQKNIEKQQQQQQGHQAHSEMKSTSAADSRLVFACVFSALTLSCLVG